MVQMGSHFFRIYPFRYTQSYAIIPATFRGSDKNNNISAR